MGLPLCAATRCPSPNDCQGYITANGGNPDLLPLVACCKVLCGQGDKGNLALQCGGASNYGAIFIEIYVMALYILAICMLSVGLFVKLKRVSFWVSALGTAIFGTIVTGIYVTYVSNSFTYLKAVVPSIGAMNISVFSFFFSGFQYSIGVAHEAGPLLALIAGAFPIWKAILKSPGQYAFLRDSNRLALTMLFFAFLWVLHSVSFRILGYRVMWRYEKASTRRNVGEPVNMCYLLGAGQGHPTWKTPMGQTTSFFLMCFAWAVWTAVRKELKNHQRCEADWVLKWMYTAPPILMTAAVVYIFLSALRGQNVRCTYFETVQAPGFWNNPRAWIKSWWLDPGPIIRRYGGPGRVGLHPGWQYYTDFGKYLKFSWREYRQVVTLHRLGRNTYTIEHVPEDMVEWPDKIIGILSWILAFLGLVMGFLVTMMMSYLARGFGAVLEWIGGRGGRLKFVRWFVVTTVSKKHADSAKELLTAAYMGPYGEDSAGTMVKLRNDLDTDKDETGRYIQLPNLLDNSSHEELHALLHKPPTVVVRQRV